MRRFAVTSAVVALAAISVVARGDSLQGETKYAPEELAKLERDGPPKQRESQRFLPDTSAAAPPGDKSAPPAKGEWSGAPAATDVRVTDPGCTAKRIREWYRIECTDGYVSLTTGSAEGVQVGATETAYPAWIVFPARMGDRRVALFLRRTKWAIAPDVIVSEQWLPGDAAPLVTVTGIAD